MIAHLRRWLLRAARRALLLGLTALLLQYSSFPLDSTWNRVSLLLGDLPFDYVSWEVAALGVKAGQTLYGLHPFLSEADRSARVRAYMERLRQAHSLEAQINTLYADPNQPDPDSASADHCAERDRLRAQLEAEQPLVEAILEGQVAAVLVEQGFGTLGQILPPVSAHFTQVPNLLITSPRDSIRFDVSINLDPLTADAITALEERVEAAENVSALVVPLGGIALYPAMILETASIPYALDTIAHEWLHHYLFAFPLGLAYFSGEGFAGETRAINETVASFFGQEMSRLVLARYYPDLLPPEPPAPLATPTRPPTPPMPPALPVFDFGRTMDTTRRTVDRLLAAGQVEEAEAYMESQRRVFAENGYLIHRLNQAFFAFYGGYQAGWSSGAAGSDPIGPAVRAIRAASPSVHDWVVAVRGITTREQLLALEAGLTNP
jgi:hypothetical protein